MKVFILLLADFPFIPFLLFVFAGGIGFYYLLVKGWKVTKKFAPSAELTMAIGLLKNQSLKRGGIIIDGDSEPILSFKHDGIEFSVSLLEGSHSDPSITYVSFQTEYFPNKNFRIASHKFKALFSFSKIKIFEGNLPSQFKVEGNDSKFIKNLLTAEIHKSLSRFQKSTEIRFGNHVGVKLALKPEKGRFYLSTEGFVGDEILLDCLIETAIAFNEQIKVLSLAYAE